MIPYSRQTIDASDNKEVVKVLKSATYNLRPIKLEEKFKNYTYHQRSNHIENLYRKLYL